MRTRLALSILRIGLATFLLAATAQGQAVWTVKLDGSGDFTSIQTAADTAAIGDTLLVSRGTYSESLIMTKGLNIIGVVTGTERVRVDLVTIRDVPAGELASVSGFRSNFGRIRIENCAGSVGVEDCDFGFSTLPTNLVILDCAAVILRSCRGTNSSVPSFIPTAGLSVQRSNVSAYDSEFRGSLGGVSCPFSCIGGNGGNGVAAAESTVHLERCTAIGGPGGDASPFPSIGFPGRSIAAGNNTTVTCHSCILQTTSVDATSALLLRSAPPLAISVPTFARETGPLDFELSGTNGLPAALLLAFTVRPITLPFVVGPLMTTAGLEAIPIGSPSGSLTIPTVVGDLLPGLGSVRFFVQLAQLRTTFPPGSQLAVGPPKLVTLLDSSIAPVRGPSTRRGLAAVS